MTEIYLAGGCFWGVEAYFQRLEGIVETEVGYANGHTTNPSYEDVCRKNTGFAETAKIQFDENKISLREVLLRYFRIIDPTVIDRQGPDVGNQYRTGIYYTDEKQLPIIQEEILELAKKYKEKIQIEIKPLENYYPAEEYHQSYLKKNPSGYCHIDLTLAEESLEGEPSFSKKDAQTLESELTELQFMVTQHAHTERPFQNEYHDHFERGIYVDITTGQPLFLSDDKFDSGCGWPSFSKPITKELLQYFDDKSHGMHRTEVKSALGESHLGHVFPDGPEEMGGLRYCINSAALRFIPLEEMQEQGYGFWLKYIK